MLITDKQLYFLKIFHTIYIRRYIQGVSEGIVNILGGGSVEYSE